MSSKWRRDSKTPRRKRSSSNDLSWSDASQNSVSVSEHLGRLDPIQESLGQVCPTKRVRPQLYENITPVPEESQNIVTKGIDSLSDQTRTLVVGLEKLNKFDFANDKWVVKDRFWAFCFIAHAAFLAVLYFSLDFGFIEHDAAWLSLLHQSFISTSVSAVLILVLFLGLVIISSSNYEGDLVYFISAFTCACFLAAGASPILCIRVLPKWACYLILAVFACIVMLSFPFLQKIQFNVMKTHISNALVSIIFDFFFSLSFGTWVIIIWLFILVSLLQMFLVYLVVVVYHGVSPYLVFFLFLPSSVWILTFCSNCLGLYLSSKLGLWYFNSQLRGVHLRLFYRIFIVNFGSCAILSFLDPISCLLSCFRSVRLLSGHRFAIAPVALYTKNYVKARAHSLKILHMKGVDDVLGYTSIRALINVQSFVCGFVCSSCLMGWLSNWNQDFELVLLIGVLGWTMLSFASQVMSTLVNSLLVFWAEDGSALSVSHQKSYVKLSEAVNLQIPSFSYYVCSSTS